MNRESNLDLLRVFCCIAVIVEHACDVFINEAKLVGGGIFMYSGNAFVLRNSLFFNAYRGIYR